MFAAGYFIIGHLGFAALSDTAEEAVDKTKEVMSEKVCKILLVLSLMLGVPQAWGKFVMLISLCHFT